MAKYRIIESGNGTYYAQHKSWFIWWLIDCSFTLRGAKQAIDKHKKSDKIVYSEQLEGNE